VGDVTFKMVAGSQEISTKCPFMNKSGFNCDLTCSDSYVYVFFVNLLKSKGKLFSDVCSVHIVQYTVCTFYKVYIYKDYTAVFHLHQ
jgi:hypothetical protein